MENESPGCAVLLRHLLGFVLLILLLGAVGGMGALFLAAATFEVFVCGAPLGVWLFGACVAAIPVLSLWLFFMEKPGYRPRPRMKTRQEIEDYNRAAAEKAAALEAQRYQAKKQRILAAIARLDAQLNGRK